MALGDPRDPRRRIDKAATEALLTKESIEELGRQGDWFAKLCANLGKTPDENEQAILEEIQRRVVSSEGTLKVELRPKRGGARKPPLPRIAPVVTMLKTIVVAQSLFREGDKDNDSMFDYATGVDQLIEAGLIPEGVAQGTADGYRIDVCSGSVAPEFLWMAVARPRSGAGVHYAVNQDGVVFVKDGPFVLDRADCKIAGGRPAGR